MIQDVYLVDVIYTILFLSLYTFKLLLIDRNNDLNCMFLFFVLF